MADLFQQVEVSLVGTFALETGNHQEERHVAKCRVAHDGFETGFANQAGSTRRGDGLELSDIYITSAVKCAPPANRPTAGEESSCAPWLLAELTSLRAAPVIVALGGLAFTRVLRLGTDLGWSIESPRPRFAHSAEVVIANGPTLLACYHPSQQNTFTGRLSTAMIDQVFERARVLAGLE